METSGIAQGGGLVGLFPREFRFFATEVAVGGGLRVDRTAQVEHLDDAARTQVEVSAHELGDLFVGDHAGAVREHGDVHRFGNADGVGDLNLTLRGETGGNDVLGDIAAGIGCGAVNLRRILAREGAAAVRAVAAVRVDDDLATGQTAVTLRTANHEAAGRVDEEAGVLEPFGRHDRTDDLFNDFVNELSLHVLALGHFRGMLRGEHDRVATDRLAVAIAERHLALGVRAQRREGAVLAHNALTLDETVGVVDRCGHEGRRFVAGVAEHQALVASTEVEFVVGGAVDTLSDVLRLLVVTNEVLSKYLRYLQEQESNYHTDAVAIQEQVLPKEKEESADTNPTKIVGKSNPFKSTLKANEIKLLTDCVNEANMFTTTVSAKILTDFFNCKLNGVLKVNNTRLLAYLMMQLGCYNYIVYEWQSVIANNKLILGKIKGEPLTRTDLSSATDQAKNIYPKGYEIIDKYIKQLKKG